MLASRPKMLSEVIKSMIGHQIDMEVVGEVLDPIELFAAVKLLPVDVIIITPLNTKGEPRICTRLLEEHPLLKIIVLSAKSETCFLYQLDAPTIRINEPTEQIILEAIRKSMQSK